MLASWDSVHLDLHLRMWSGLTRSVCLLILGKLSLNFMSSKQNFTCQDFIEEWYMIIVIFDNIGVESSSRCIEYLLQNAIPQQ
jgi:hypothetical protein